MNCFSDILASYLIENVQDIHKIKTIGAYQGGSVHYIISMLACWKLNKIFVPLSIDHTENEINYFIEDSEIKVLLSSADTHKIKLPVAPMVINVSTINQKNTFNQKLYGDYCKEDSKNSANKDAAALVLYTSGTTGKPKGVLHSKQGLDLMIKALSEYWDYNSNDRILHFLPLHHLHGMLNKLLCVLYAGGCIDFIHSHRTSTSAKEAMPLHILIWKILSSEYEKPSCNRPYSLFMGVPTVYSRLLEESKIVADTAGKSKLNTRDIQNGIEVIKKMRLTVCGSAALPDIVMEDWMKLTGHVLLERYGMTELGMCLSNPYNPITDRLKGCVGYPLAKYECTLVDDNGNIIERVDTPGELRVRGPCMFLKYLNKETVTRESFDSNGSFITGDIASVNANGNYRILGRKGTDIIKSAGYKLSALEIERELLSHPAISEAVVVGQQDAALGEKVVAILSIRDNKQNISLKSIKEYLHDKLAYYKHPKELFVVAQGAIPRNHLGKVNKKTIMKDLNLIS